MKETKYSILLAMGLFPALLCAREKEQKLALSGGPLVEMNATGFIHSGFTSGNSSMRTGLSVGGFLNLGISGHFSVQGEISFQYRHSEFGWENSGGCYRYWGVEIPVYAMYHHTLANGGRIHVGIGPYTNLGLDATFKTASGKKNLYEKAQDTGLPPMKDSDTGFSIKAGYEFRCGLQLNVSFRASVTNLIDSNSSEVKMYPIIIGAGVAYRFGKKGGR